MVAWYPLCSVLIVVFTFVCAVSYALLFCFITQLNSLTLSNEFGEKFFRLLKNSVSAILTLLEAFSSDFKKLTYYYCCGFLCSLCYIVDIDENPQYNHFFALVLAFSSLTKQRKLNDTCIKPISV